MCVCVCVCVCVGGGGGGGGGGGTLTIPPHKCVWDAPIITSGIGGYRCIPKVSKQRRDLLECMGYIFLKNEFLLRGVYWILESSLGSKVHAYHSLKTICESV